MRPDEQTARHGCAAAQGSGDRADPGGPLSKRARLWGPWLAVAVVVAAYGAELFREASVGIFPFKALPLQLALASPVVALLVLSIIALQQTMLPGGMTRRVRRLVFWAPRIAVLLFAGFVGLFALDVFGAGYGAWETLLALLVHLLPSAVLLVAAMLAWRRPWIGAACSVGWAAWYLAAFWGRFPVSVYALMVGAPLLIGVLFVLDWRCKADAQTLQSGTAGVV